MKKENFIKELLNTAKILESLRIGLRIELSNIESFDDKVIKLIKLINKDNYRIEILNVENNCICFVAKPKYGLIKYPKQIFTFWKGNIKQDTLIIYKDNTIMWNDLNYSIDEIIEEISFFQNNITKTTI